MTGIERLRELADDLYEVNLWVKLRPETESKYDATSDDDKTINDLLNDIADQIEREWDALVKESPYDALPPDEREAIAWVREHGGIAYAKDAWNVRSNLDRQLEKAQAKVERQQRHIEFVQSKCRERQTRIVELNKTVAEMRPRLMPEGMERLVEAWPRFEDEEPVKFGDMALIDGEADMVEAVQLWIHGRPVIYGDGGSQQLERGERVKRPAKVLDADGAEIRVGDTVYHVGMSTFDPEYNTLTVTDIRTKPGLTPIETKNSHNGYLYGKPEDFTHRAPVLAADGRPLREGETVWNENGLSFKVTAMNPEGDSFEAIRDLDGSKCYLNPKVFTHERPEIDSWERLWMDMHPADETECVGLDRDEFVRRAKALAERGQRWPRKGR